MKSFFLSLILICTAFAAAPAAASTGPVDSGHVVLELIPGSEAAAPGSTTYVALKQTIDKGWHTYWRNPGDSGEATTIGWTLPQGWRAGNIVWATPRKLPVGPLMNYGYENEVVLPVPLTVPATARPGQTMRLKAEVALLVCELLCVPESAHLELDVPVVAGQAAPHPKWGAAVALALGRAPKPTNLTATFRREGDALRLSVAGEKLSSAKANDAYFFAFDGTAVKAASPQTVERGTNGLTLSLAPGESLEGGETLKTLAGVLTTDGRAYEITAVPGAPVKGAFGLGAPSSESGGGGGLGLPLAIAFAFAGGLILNLMPCVFPVLSMKAASLAAHAHGGEARRQGLAFTAGVLAAFLALAVVLIAARAAGGAAGWGFQLQSPGVVAALALLMLAIAFAFAGGLIL
ncbi:MAG: protein-disulfide reductase DsbD domain-containing protein, partial [Caulobacteraceae bacterium]